MGQWNRDLRKTWQKRSVWEHTRVRHGGGESGGFESVFEESMMRVVWMFPRIRRVYSPATDVLDLPNRNVAIREKVRMGRRMGATRMQN
ncbi:hypothetical protein B0A54_06129 [Friedmanniomyces endolithicus]|uniref:Uncharacterized protein n=1 Tax=Friedmanniomyces endolithicus TaxID=329885 RepID=A0A4U0V3D8_9PEZI|nr:hypothetical protein B0A54_06129 [Friedmanniomyces endolithicus]